MASPVLAIFGEADAGIPAAQVAAFETALAAADVEHQVVMYPGAQHGFFHREATEFAQASASAWQRVTDFIATHSPRA